MARPERFELPTFWFVGGKSALQQTTAADNSQRNQQEAHTAFGCFRLVLYPVHGKLHGKFKPYSVTGRERLHFGFRHFHGVPVAMLFLRVAGCMIRILPITSLKSSAVGPFGTHHEDFTFEE
jgi:hypothetical protein